MKKRSLVMGAMIAFVTAPIAQAQPRGDWSDGYGHMMWGGGYGLFGGLMMLVFWGVVIALIILAVRWFSQGGSGLGSNRDAMDILRERFAKGEIDEDEFEGRKKALEN